ncbi:peroxidase 70-like [Phragmites australis]|uniref:peroxidase 70-like n=1 Tax=Phragmites australis TaxID=29695 RepID=UPI002D76DFC2|nr:peroxidase 70-like [Phragmites australis]
MAPAASSRHRSRPFPSLLILTLALTLFATVTTKAQLSENYYDASCPAALLTIRTAVAAAVLLDRRMGASLLRLHFHDCFVQGCDASVLLDDTGSFTGEKGAGPNAGSLRGFEVIDNIKMLLELLCPQTVSCADILAVAARDSVGQLGGPYWTVLLGRRDSTTASASLANSDLPGPKSNLNNLLNTFANKGLSSTDMVALSGAHTVGRAQCKNCRARIYNDTDIDASFAASLRTGCPQQAGANDGALEPLDASSPDAFDNGYFGNLLSQRGLLHSDQALFDVGTTDDLVRTYASNSDQWGSDFVAAMVKMGNISPLTGTDNGEIRMNCRRVN